MRLQKFLANAGICSRRKAEEYISQGRVKVNNNIIVEPGIKVDPEKDIVFFDTDQVILNQTKENIYIALNKPVGFISSCSHSHRKEKIILDLINVEERIYPVGRLDKDSEGLILLTNDGDLHNKLSHPSFDHEKEYDVKTYKIVFDDVVKKLEQGVFIDGEKTRKSKVTRLSKFRIKIVLKQGRNRQIRKMLENVGNRVKSLKRIRVANITLGKLKQGEWRYLTKKEIQLLGE
ncbi:MAG: rRNA pseudouridine synthase [Desulfobacteraceae bacterium]|nr:rRNA pseudouridine synthase [Desulfobacteraceae bacterium]